MGWLQMHPSFHDQPARDISIRGVNFASMNPLVMGTKGESMLVRTGPFQPLGESGAKSIRGTTKASGTILRFNPDGSGLEVFAWGLRNPFGVAWGRDGRLYVTENGYDERGSRPIANAPESIWVIRQGAWYGFPDFAGGEPVTSPKFKGNDAPEVEFLMANHPPVEKPLATRPPHVALTKLDVGRQPFGNDGDLFIGEFGDMIPMTANNEEQRGGHQVVRVNSRSGAVETFFRARPEALGRGPTKYVTTPGPKRIVDVRFSPSGDALYVVDLGAMAVLPTPVPTLQPLPTSGVIWRISRSETQPSGPTQVSFTPGSNNPRNRTR